LSGEATASFAGIPGTFCAPFCGSEGSCPQDKPAGVTATPNCGVGSGSDKRCGLQCSSSLPGKGQNATNGQCGANASCKKCGYCTYDTGPAPAPTPPPPAGLTHYDDPAKGCLSDEQQTVIDGIPGCFCSPPCNSDGSCPQDKPRGVTANPQCDFGTASDAYCAMCCATSLPIRDQKAADSQCGAATCHPAPGQNFGLCTYAKQPSPGQTHYGDPGRGAGQGNCLSDEHVIDIVGVPGRACSPPCNSDGSCPQDKPRGVTANPQCVLHNGATSHGCALCCATSLPIRDQKAADSQCSTATCHLLPGQNFGLCTYAV
jgi:hypothetical protein